MSNNIRALILGPFLVSTKFVIFLTFVVFVYSGGTMTAEKVFMTISLYQAVRLSTTLFIPFAFQFLSEARVTTNRLQVSSSLSFLSNVINIDLHPYFYVDVNGISPIGWPLTPWTLDYPVKWSLVESLVVPVETQCSCWLDPLCKVFRSLH